MAYSDYGAFVFKNGERREDKEDVGIYDTEEAKYPSGARIWMNLIRLGAHEGREVKWWEHVHHGIMGDGKVRVCCHKQGFPKIWVWDDGAEEPRQIPQSEIVRQNGWAGESWVSEFDDGSVWIGYDYPPLRFAIDELEGYEFEAWNDDRPYVATMREPDGTVWRCEYDYEYGAGF